MLATFVAGALGIGAHCLATLSGRTAEPILIAIFVFLIGKLHTHDIYYKIDAIFDIELIIFVSISVSFCSCNCDIYEILSKTEGQIRLRAVNIHLDVQPSVCIRLPR